MARKDRSPEEQAVRKAASRAKRQNKRSALNSVLTFVRERKNVPDEIKSAVMLITPGQRIGGGGPSKLKVFADLFTKKSRVPEMEIYTDFNHMGRGEMRKVCVNLIKKQKPDDRIWVRLDAANEVYLVEGFGPNCPADWTGYRPVEVEDTEIV